VRRSALVLGLLAAAAGCANPVAGPGARTLTYAQVQSLNPGVPARWILEEFPFARDVRRDADGRVLSMGYWVEDPLGKTRGLVLRFDERERLAEKAYGGPHVRPPEPGGLPTPQGGR
jgi:hypothetical protein